MPKNSMQGRTLAKHNCNGYIGLFRCSLEKKLCSIRRNYHFQIIKHCYT